MRIVLFPCGLTLIVLATAFYCTPANAQALGWEGETGVFVTPMAYTASAEGQKLHAVAAYHFFDAGPVIGDFHEASIELGIGKRFELGYTHEYHVFGGDPSLSPLWQNGFETFNGKVNLVPENYQKTKWVPAISTGFLARTDVRNVGDYEPASTGTGMNPFASGKNNGDFYLVGTKVVPVKPVPIVLNLGVRGTNAELWGMGGNAPDWEARSFGAIAFVFKGPAKSTIIFGSEYAQQPHHPLGYTETDVLPLNIPTTLTYCARVLPSPKHKLNIDFGIAQVAGEIAPGVNLKARHQAGVQLTYGF
ncbi:MAG TPA: hypothetical protein VME23_01080 [Terracidiphilus sp.]|nr:hypothetical protein [Terracidiphilus sp.]